MHARTMLVLTGISSLAVSCLMQTAAATTVVADTTGPDSYSTADYYGVAFQACGVDRFIQSITFDLSADGDAYFDFDGNGNFGNVTNPVLGTLTGLLASDISFVFLAPVGGDLLHPAQLRLEFAPGSFGVGDSLRFATDTDSFWNGPPNPGGDFGLAGATLSVILFGGAADSTAFVTLSPQRSTALVVPTPLPGALLLLGSAVIGMFGVRRRAGA